MKLKKLRRRADGGGVVDRRSVGARTGASGMPRHERFAIVQGRRADRRSSSAASSSCSSCRRSSAAEGRTSAAWEARSPVRPGGRRAGGLAARGRPAGPDGEVRRSRGRRRRLRVGSRYFDRGGLAYTDPTVVLFRGSTSHRLRDGAGVDGPVLLPGVQPVYLDPSFVQWTLESRFEAQGLRRGLRHRPRDRAPRAEPARDREAGPPAPGPVSGPGERPVRADGAASGLLRRRVGTLGVRPRDPAARRHRGGR